MKILTKIKVFSLFTGIGGMELGILQALGEEKVEFVGYSEIDKYATSIFHFSLAEMTPAEYLRLP